MKDKTKSIRYTLWCDKGFLGFYDTKEQAIEFLEIMTVQRKVWVNAGTYLIKYTTEEERIDICR